MNPENSQPPQSVSPAEIQQAIDRVMASKHFAHAPMKQKFLRLICDFHLAGRGAELNEYLIGREVFDRDNSYNPATDPIVRVGAHGVREKLERYYQKEGANDEIRIEIPIGNYEPTFVRVGQPQNSPVENAESSFALSAPVVSEQTIPEKPNLRRNYRLYVTVAAVSLLFAALLYSNFSLRQQLNQRQESLEMFQPVWSSFLNSSDPTLMVLSNPPVFRFLNSADPDPIVKKSFPIVTPQSTTIFDELPSKSIIRIIPNPRLALTTDTYTGIGEAIGIHRITDLFRTADKSVRLKQSRTVSAEDLQDQNVIALGSVWVNNWSSSLPAIEDFVYTDQVTVLNLNPRPGEEAEYRADFDPQSGKLIQDYALITVAPNLSNRDVVMVVAGLHSEGTAAAAEFITGKQYLPQFNQRLAQTAAGGKTPKFFQALLKVGVENGIPTYINLVTIHELQGKAR
ncbi:MAG: hypothetical protein JNK38_25585 [Acidobacteria bacterium]|nr:hypothetical protein [Acidobacteriota bacterium]